MTTLSSFDLERFWDDILSRDQKRIRAAYTGLSKEEQLAVSAHLYRMANEPGWHPEQRGSAFAALRALEQEV